MPDWLVILLKNQLVDYHYLKFIHPYCGQKRLSNQVLHVSKLSWFSSAALPAYRKFMRQPPILISIRIKVGLTASLLHTTAH